MLSLHTLNDLRSAITNTDLFGPDVAGVLASLDAAGQMNVDTRHSTAYASYKLGECVMLPMFLATLLTCRFRLRLRVVGVNLTTQQIENIYAGRVGVLKAKKCLRNSWKLTKLSHL